MQRMIDDNLLRTSDTTNGGATSPALTTIQNEARTEKTIETTTKEPQKAETNEATEHECIDSRSDRYKKNPIKIQIKQKKKKKMKPKPRNPNQPTSTPTSHTT